MQTPNDKGQVYLTPDVLQRLEYHHCLQVMEELDAITWLGPGVLKRFKEYLTQRSKLYEAIFHYIEGMYKRTEIEPVLQLFKMANDKIFTSDLGEKLSNCLVDAKICGVDSKYRSVWYKTIDELTNHAHELAAEALILRLPEFDPMEESSERVNRFLEHKREVIHLSRHIYKLDIDLDELNSHDPQVVYDAVMRSVILLLIKTGRST